MADAFQARFQELVKGGALINEARTQALREIHPNALHGRWCVCRKCMEAEATEHRSLGGRVAQALRRRSRRSAVRKRPTKQPNRDAGR